MINGNMATDTSPTSNLGSASATMRALQAMTVTTTRCPTLRTDRYRAKLELVYDYIVEYTGNDRPDLVAVETAVAYGIAAALDSCDENGNPLHAVELASKHQFADKASCSSSVTGNTCYVVRGYTSIQLDDNAALAQTIAYDAIEMALNQPHFLQQFVATPFARLDFIEPVRSSLVLLPDEEGVGGRTNPTSKAAIAAIVVSAVLALIFLAGLLRRYIRAKKATKKKKLTEPSSKHRFLLGSAPRKSYYILDDEFKEANSSGGIQVMINAPISPTITWSVSDITSESGSIVSKFSRTTSNLERIEEEEHESQTSGEWDMEDTLDECDPNDEADILVEDLYGLSPRRHVGQWDVQEPSRRERQLYDVEEGLEGCQFLDDSQEGYENIYHPAYKMECSEDYGLDTSEELHTSADADISDDMIISQDDLHTSGDELMDTSDERSETVEENRAVPHVSGVSWCDISDDRVQRWMVDLLKELRKTQKRKLIANE